MTGAQTRREFLRTSALAGAAILARPVVGEDEEQIIDIHQHTNYHGRSDADLLKHQEAMGVSQTVLLPAGIYYGLDAQCGGNESCRKIAEEHPGRFLYFANELPYLAAAKATITKYLKEGAKGIGEQKFRVLADSGYLEKIAAIAKEFSVPVLLHFWDHDYNMELGRFHKILEKFPSVNFIGHAQTWWGSIDKNHDPKVAYPKGKVTPGGITDRLLADYPNMFGDLSAGSGLNALTRDPEHTAAFLQRHKEKLLFGSDCEDALGTGPKCTGAQIIATVRKSCPDREARRLIFSENAKKLLKI